MAKKTRNIGIMIVIAIVIGVVFSIITIQANTINDVERFKNTEVNSKTAEFSWREVNSAEGYYLYVSPSGEDNFKKVAEVKSESLGTVSGKIEKLKQASSYDVYVTAFKERGEKVIESEGSKLITIQTLPVKQEIMLTSPDEGMLNIDIVENNLASGYEVEYMKGSGLSEDDFKKAELIDITERSDHSISFDSFEPEAYYSARARSYIDVGKDRIYGAWSEIAETEISKKIEMPSDIDPSKPMVALTFDDGPGYNSASDEILDVLEKYGARATFFMVGKNAADHPKNVARKVALGCEIGNHTYNHEHYGKNVSASDISKATKAIKKAGGVAPTAFRSPGGNTTDSIRSECKKEGMALYYWSLDTEDWKYRDSKKIYNSVIKNVEDGDIILMHEIYGTTAEAVAKIVPKLIKKGYQLVTCEELIQAKSGKAPQAGTQYLNGTTIKNETH